MWAFLVAKRPILRADMIILDGSFSDLCMESNLDYQQQRLFFLRLKYLDYFTEL
jgi:hypothetical protein